MSEQECKVRKIIGVLVLGLLISSSHAAPPQTRLIVPFGPGGPADRIVHNLVDDINKTFPIVSENKGGASGNVAFEYFLSSCGAAKPCMLLVGPPLLSNQFYYDNFNRKIFDQSEPIAYVGDSPVVVWVRKDLPASTLPELFRLRKLAIANGGEGTVSGFGTNLLLKSLDKESVSVPYKAAANIIADLLGGRIDVFPTFTFSLEGHYRQNLVKPLAILSKTRSSNLPEVPTAIEQGYPFNLGGWFILLINKDADPKFKADMKILITSLLSNRPEKYQKLGLENLLSVKDFPSFYKEQTEFFEKYK